MKLQSKCPETIIRSFVTESQQDRESLKRIAADIWAVHTVEMLRKGYIPIDIVVELIDKTSLEYKLLLKYAYVGKDALEVWMQYEGIKAVPVNVKE